MNPLDKAKPCPKCKGTILTLYHYCIYVQVECKNCLLFGPRAYWHCPERAVDNWNNMLRED